MYGCQTKMSIYLHEQYRPGSADKTTDCPMILLIKPLIVLWFNRLSYDSTDCPRIQLVEC